MRLSTLSICGLSSISESLGGERVYIKFALYVLFYLFVARQFSSNTKFELREISFKYSSSVPPRYNHTLNWEGITTGLVLEVPLYPLSPEGVDYITTYPGYCDRCLALRAVALLPCGIVVARSKA